jgi:hypothetical protein
VMNLQLKRLAVSTALAVAAFAGIQQAGAAVPSGEVTFGQSVVEPTYNGLDGSFAFLLTPEHRHVNPNAPVAEIYLIMYPTEAAGAIGTVICAHQPLDNCPDHGPLLASLAEAMEPTVYANGVWGHDHIADMPTAPQLGKGDFEVNWLPVMVLFNSLDTASTHFTTTEQVEEAEAAGLVTEVPLPPATFHGSPVSDAVYNKGTPVEPVQSVP